MDGATPQAKMKLFPLASILVYKQPAEVILFFENHIKLRM